MRDELKCLYTAITRTRLKLIIFDENTIKRKSIEKILEFLDLADFEDDIDNFKKKIVFYFIRNLMSS